MVGILVPSGLTLAIPYEKIGSTMGVLARADDVGGSGTPSVVSSVLESGKTMAALRSGDLVVSSSILATPGRMGRMSPSRATMRPSGKMLIHSPSTNLSAANFNPYTCGEWWMWIV